MNYQQACRQAYDYFNENLGISGLAVATENEDKWFFSPGREGENRIGISIISKEKRTGKLSLVNHMSKEGWKEIKMSSKLEVPEKFRADNE